MIKKARIVTLQGIFNEKVYQERVSRSGCFLGNTQLEQVSLRPRIVQNGAFFSRPKRRDRSSTSASERNPRETATACWQTLSGYSVPKTRWEFFWRRLASRSMPRRYEQRTQ